MNLRNMRFAALKDQRGQVLPWFAFMIFLFLGISAFVLDVGHAYICQRQLQAATDAAALAGAAHIYDSTSMSMTRSYSGTTGTSGAPNFYATLQAVSMAPGWPVIKCLQTVQNMGFLCEGPNSANAIQVKEQAVIPTFFAQAFGIRQLTLSATATASKGDPTPLNVAILVDTTLSMNTEDTNCNNTALGCAMSGVQQLLAGLAPSVDAVSVFTFPNIQSSTQSDDTRCSPPQSLNPAFNTSPTSGLATALPYSFPVLPAGSSTNYTVPSGTGTYQITNFSSDYRNSDASQTSNSNSTLVMTVGSQATKTSPAVSGCLAPPNNAGDYGTYLAGVIYAAQTALAYEKASEIATNPAGTPVPVNIMIILSDGNTNASMHYQGVGNQFFVSGYNETGVYPSDVGDCGQQVVAAGAAKSAGTLIYTIAYGSPATGVFNWNPNDVGDSINNAGCPTDQNSFFSAFHLGANVSAYPNISPCQSMIDMASTPASQYFYSDYNQSGSNSQCYSPNAESPSALGDIFATIAGSLSNTRLIPDNVN